METEAEVEKSVALIKEAASTRAVPSGIVLKALLQLEKKKLAVRFSLSNASHHKTGPCELLPYESLRHGRDVPWTCLFGNGMLLIVRMGVQDDSYSDAVGGGKGGKRWKLVYNASVYSSFHNERNLSKKIWILQEDCQS